MDGGFVERFDELFAVGYRAGYAVLGRRAEAEDCAQEALARALYAAGDPTNPPAEGELSVVDSALVTAGGRAFVSTCCEPVPGTWFEVTGGEPGPDQIAYGHGLALAPDGRRIATEGAQAITVSDLDRDVVATADLSSSAGRFPIFVRWLDDATLAVIEERQDDSGITYWLYTVDAGLTAAPAAQGVQVGAGLETSPPDFAGRADDGSILLFAGERGRTVSTTLVAYDPQNLAARPGSDITLPGTAVDAWYDGHRVWVGADDVLHVDGAEVPGEFAWARPVP